MNKYSVFIISIFILVSSVEAQLITHLNSKMIEVNGVEHAFEESGEIFKLVPIAYSEFHNAININKSADIFGYISLGCLTGGLVLAYVRIGNASPRKLTGPQVVGVISVVVAFPLFGTIGVINKTTAKKSQKRAIHLYNNLYEKYRSLKDQESDINLAFGMSSNGVGFIITF